MADAFEYHQDTSALEARLREAGRRGYDLAPLLKDVGKVWKDEAREKIRTGEGMPPLSPATIEKRQHTGTSLITKHGDVRASRAREIESNVKRLQGSLAWANRRYFGLGRFVGMPEKMRKRVARWQRELASLNRQLAKAQEGQYAERKTGKSVADRWSKRGGGFRLGQRFISSLYLKVERHGQDWALLVASYIAWSDAQNKGGTVGHGSVLPPTYFLVLTAAKVDYLTRRLRAYLTEPLP